MGRKKIIAWDKTYRLSLFENQTHKRIGSWLFTRLGLLVLAITAAVTVLAVAFFLISITPLRTLMPGYPDTHFKRDAIANAIKIDSLESAITRWNLYAENLSRVLAGEENLRADSVLSSGRNAYLARLSKAEIARQDSILRREIEKEEQFGISGKAERKLSIEGMHFFTPVKGAVTRTFDRTIHPYVEVMADAESAICSVLDGSIVHAGWSDEGGWTIVIQHKGNIVSTCSNSRKLLVSTGDKISAGTPVAIVGDNGNAIHFELWNDGDPVDPQQYIKF